MNKEDLKDLLAFAEYKNMMQCPVIQVYSLYLQDLQDRFEDYIADQELMRQLEL
jgi:hypothetical protein|nr:MAG TPA: hypothetical protein [Crassvirales sp.]